MLILLPYLQQLLKQLYPLGLQLSGIHQLIVMLPPGTQVALLGDELRGFAAVGLEKVDRFLPLGEPEFGLGHWSFKGSIVISDDKKISFGCYPSRLSGTDMVPVPFQPVPEQNNHGSC